MNSNAYAGFYMTYDQLIRGQEETVSNTPSFEEMDEIRRIAKLVDELSQQNMKFCTTT